MLAFLQAALLIFCLRLVDISFYTLRLMSLVRGRKAQVWLFAFMQAFVFAVALRSVFSDLANIGKLAGYVTGYATGMVLGMWIEEHLALGYTHLSIVSPRYGTEICEQLRTRGYAVTEISGQGKDGTVTLLSCNVLRKEARQVQKIITDTDPQAFVTAQAVRPVQRGRWQR